MPLLIRRLFLLTFLSVFFAFGVSGCESYDKLIELDEGANQKWSNIDVALQRRHDLIGNLVNTVKGSAKFEQETLEKVIQARSAATSIKLTTDDLTDPAKVKAFNDAQGSLNSAVSRLLVSQEKYPELKASAQFRDLMVELEGSENRIARAREEYNKAAGAYNTELRKIKGSAVNKATGKPFKPREYFTATTPDAKTAPQVQF